MTHDDGYEIDPFGDLSHKDRLSWENQPKGFDLGVPPMAIDFPYDRHKETELQMPEYTKKSIQLSATVITLSIALVVVLFFIAGAVVTGGAILEWLKMILS